MPLGTVYYFFKTKEAIGQALVEHYLQNYRNACEQWNSYPDPKARLEAFLQLMLGDRERLSQSVALLGRSAQNCTSRGMGCWQAKPARFSTNSWLGLRRSSRRLARERAAGLATHLLSAVEGAILLAQSFHTPEYLEREAEQLTQWIRSL